MQTASGGGATSSGGSCTAGTATAADVLAGITFPDGSGGMTTGTMSNRGSWSLSGASAVAAPAFPGAGYYSGITNAPATSNYCAGTYINGANGTAICDSSGALILTPSGGSAGGTVELSTDLSKLVTVTNSSASQTASGIISLGGTDAASLELITASNCILANGNIYITLGPSDSATFLVVKKASFTSSLSASLSVSSPAGSQTISITTGVLPYTIRAWYKPNSIVYANVTDGDGSGTLTTGDVIATWPDVSGNSYDAISTATNPKPIYIAKGLNNQPTVISDSYNSGSYFVKNFANSPWGITAGIALTFVNVFRMGSSVARTAVGPLIWQNGDGAGTYNYGIDPNTWATAGSRFGFYVGGHSMDTAIATDYKFHVHLVHSSTTAVGQSITGNTTYYLDGSSTALTVKQAGVSAGNFTDLTQSNRASFGGWGETGEVFVLTGALSNAARTALQCYLSQKYSLNLSGC